VGRRLLLIFEPDSSQQLALCTASRHIPTSLLSVRRPVPPPLL
jgi:hypothetical protein